MDENDKLANLRDDIVQKLTLVIEKKFLELEEKTTSNIIKQSYSTDNVPHIILFRTPIGLKERDMPQGYAGGDLLRSVINDNSKFKSRDATPQVYESELFSGIKFPTAQYSILGDKEKAILKFITDNPNTTKQKVVNEFDGKYARVTVFDIIKRLDENNIIIVSPDPENRQTHNISINKESILLYSIQISKDLQQAFFKVMYKFQQTQSSKIGEMNGEKILTFFYEFLQFIECIMNNCLNSIISKDNKSITKSILVQAYNNIFFVYSEIIAEITYMIHKYSSKPSQPVLNKFKTHAEIKISEEFNNLIKEFKVKEEVKQLLESCQKTEKLEILKVF